MSLKALHEIQKKPIQPVYFFYGEEEFLIDEAITWVQQQMMAEMGQTGVTTLDLTEVSIQTLVQTAQTPSFLDSRRCIVGRNAMFTTTAKEKKEGFHRLSALLSYLEEPVKSSVVILSVAAEGIDQRKKVVKELKKRACVSQMDRLQGQALLNWLIDHIGEMDGTIERQAAYQLLLWVGNSLRLLHQECIKLMTYVGTGGTITYDMVMELVPRTLEQDVFKLTNGLMERDMDQVFSLWYDLLYQQEEPLRILALITRQIRVLLQVKILLKQQMTDQQIAAVLKIHPYPVKLARKQCPHFSEESLRKLLSLAICAEQEIKLGKINKEVAVERILFSV